MWTVTPRSQEVPTGSGGKSLTFACNVRQQYDSTTGDRLLWTFSGNACADFGVIDLKVNGPIVFKPKFHVCDVSPTEVEMGSAAESWADTEPLQVFGANTLFSLVDWAAGGNIARPSPELKLLGAKINLGMSCSPIYAAGSGTVNQCQGFMCQYDPTKAFIELDIMFDYDKLLTDWLSSNGAKSIEITQGATSTDHPTFGFWVPKGYLMEQPKIEHFKGSYHTMTCKYSMRPCDWTSALPATSINDSAAYNAWYMAFGGASS
jgi:hypothetical protein